jgi:AraC-like DNA-binding protein
MQRDREEKASPRIQPVLAHLEVHFLDHGFTVAVWWEACGVRDNALSTRFARDLGYTPGVYLRRRRMEVAAEMLEATDLKVWKIADLVCYPNVGSFCRAFKEWSGLKPSDYRKTARKAAREAESLELDMRDLARALLQGEVARMDRACHSTSRRGRWRWTAPSSSAPWRWRTGRTCATCRRRSRRTWCAVTTA